MDVIITALGELIWTASCAAVNFCVSSGLNVIAVFVSFLCAILASAFYKYTINRDQMAQDDGTCMSIDQDNNDLDKSIMIIPTTESSAPPLLPTTTAEESNNTDPIESLAEIEISIEEDTNENESENHQLPANDLLIDTIEGSEEEIQKQQIANIYRLLNDQHLINNWTTTDFLDQLNMYGLHTYDEDDELESS